MHVARHLFTTWAFSLSLSPLPHHFSSAVWSHRCDLSLAWDITFVTSPTWQKARNLQWRQLASVRVRVHGCLFVTFADLRQKQCLPLALISPHFICSRPPPEQARRELRRLKEEARQKHAVAVIWAYWQGLQVPSSPPHHGTATTKSSTYHSPPHGSISSSTTVSFFFFSPTSTSQSLPTAVITLLPMMGLFLKPLSGFHPWG